MIKKEPQTLRSLILDDERRSRYIDRLNKVPFAMTTKDEKVPSYILDIFNPIFWKNEKKG